MYKNSFNYIIISPFSITHQSPHRAGLVATTVAPAPQGN